MLATDTEVRIDVGVGEPRSYAVPSTGSGGSVGLVPASAVGLGRWGGEVGRDRPAGPAHDAGFAYFLMLAWCCLKVLAKAVVPLPSPFARKYI